MENAWPTNVKWLRDGNNTCTNTWLAQGTQASSFDALKEYTVQRYEMFNNWYNWQANDGQAIPGHFSVSDDSQYVGATIIHHIYPPTFYMKSNAFSLHKYVLEMAQYERKSLKSGIFKRESHIKSVLLKRRHNHSLSESISNNFFNRTTSRTNASGRICSSFPHLFPTPTIKQIQTL